MVDQYDGPNQLGPFVAQNQLATLNGGPELLMKTVEDFGFQEGFKAGIKKGFEQGIEAGKDHSILVGIVAATAGVLLGGVVGGVAVYLSKKKKPVIEVEEKVSAEEAAVAKRNLIDCMKNAEGRSDRSQA